MGYSLGGDNVTERRFVAGALHRIARELGRLARHLVPDMHPGRADERRAPGMAVAGQAQLTRSVAMDQARDMACTAHAL